MCAMEEVVATRDELRACASFYRASCGAVMLKVVPSAVSYGTMHPKVQGQI